MGLSIFRQFRSLDLAAAIGFMAYAATATITPICLVILARELSFSLVAAGALEVARSVLAIAVMLVSGFLAAHFGKVRSLGWAGLLLGVGMFVYAVAPTYGVIVIALALLGIGGGVMDALINPLVCELHPQDAGRFLNFINAFWSVGVLITMLLSGELLTRGVSWRFIAAGIGVVGIFSGVAFLFFGRNKARVANQRLTEVWDHKRGLLGKPAFWLFFAALFVAGAIEGAFTFWSASLIQLEFGGSPRAAGLAAASFAAGMIAARLTWGLFLRQRHLWHLLVGSCLLGIPVSLLLPLAPQVVTAILLLFGGGVACAALWPSIQSYAVDRLRVDATALFILLSCGGIPGFAFSAWLMGFIGDSVGLRVSFWCLPGLFVVLLVLLLRERRPWESKA